MNNKILLRYQICYHVHVRRHHSLQKLVLEGKVDGKRGRGRRRKSWTGNMSEMTKMGLAQCSVKALQPLRKDGTPID